MLVGGVLVVGQWRASSTGQQQAAVNAAADAWETVQWPAGLLSPTQLSTCLRPRSNHAKRPLRHRRRPGTADTDPVADPRSADTYERAASSQDS